MNIVETHTHIVPGKKAVYFIEPVKSNIINIYSSIFNELLSQPRIFFIKNKSMLKQYDLFHILKYSGRVITSSLLFDCIANKTVLSIDDLPALNEEIKSLQTLIILAKYITLKNASELRKFIDFCEHVTKKSAKMSDILKELYENKSLSSYMRYIVAELRMDYSTDKYLHILTLPIDDAIKEMYNIGAIRDKPFYMPKFVDEIVTDGYYDSMTAEEYETHLLNEHKIANINIHPYLSIKHILANPLIKWNFRVLSTYIPFTDIIANPDLPWCWINVIKHYKPKFSEVSFLLKRSEDIRRVISIYSNITMYDIYKYKNILDFDGLTVNESIMINDIMENSELSWNMQLLPANPNMTESEILKYDYNIAGIYNNKLSNMDTFLFLCDKYKSEMHNKSTSLSSGYTIFALF